MLSHDLGMKTRAETPFVSDFKFPLRNGERVRPSHVGVRAIGVEQRL